MVGFLPGGRTWRGPPRHGLLRHPQEAPSQGRRGAAPGPLKCLVGVLLRRRRLSQPQQHGGSGHTERAPDPEPGRKRGRARTLGPSALGREKRAGPSRVGRGGGLNRWSRPVRGGASDLGMPAVNVKLMEKPSGEGGTNRWKKGEHEKSKVILQVFKRHLFLLYICE